MPLIYFSQHFTNNHNSTTTAGFKCYNRTFNGSNNTLTKLIGFSKNIQTSTTTICHHYNNSRNNPTPLKLASNTPPSSIDFILPTYMKPNTNSTKFNSKLSSQVFKQSTWHPHKISWFHRSATPATFAPNHLPPSQDFAVTNTKSTAKSK